MHFLPNSPCSVLPTETVSSRGTASGIPVPFSFSLLSEILCIHQQTVLLRLLHRSLHRTSTANPEYSVPVGIELENLIIEGSRHTREKEFLEEEIPSLDVALKFTERPGMDIQKVNLSVDEWKVVSYVNPQNSIKQIAKATKMKDLEIRRIVYSLVQAGLVEFVRQAGGVPAQMPTFPKPERDEQRSLVNRLIDRIRSI